MVLRIQIYTCTSTCSQGLVSQSKPTYKYRNGFHLGCCLCAGVRARFSIDSPYSMSGFIELSLLVCMFAHVCISQKSSHHHHLEMDALNIKFKAKCGNFWLIFHYLFGHVCERWFVAPSRVCCAFTWNAARIVRTNLVSGWNGWQCQKGWQNVHHHHCHRV